VYPSPLGLWIGLILGLAFLVDGLRGVVLAVIFGGFGWFVEKVVRGEIDLGDRSNSQQDT